mmetsp:Transcript_126832/g.370816  ORF Transcript_126832/g.370816 Transcript_126832/m.370816 type:complete len:93 (+) Transcript_126832:259-537(+)
MVKREIPEYQLAMNQASPKRCPDPEKTFQAAEFPNALLLNGLAPPLPPNESMSMLRERSPGNSTVCLYMCHARGAPTSTETGIIIEIAEVAL